MESILTIRSKLESRCLNPYCNGRYSWRISNCIILRNLDVLILIVMEDTHGDTIESLSTFQMYKVLILIIMEDTHGVLIY